MANQIVDVNGHPIRLVDLGDGTFAVKTDSEADVTVHDPITSENKLKINTDGSVNTQLSGNNYLEATLQDAVKKNDDGMAMTVAGNASLVLQVSGTFTATVNFEATQDGTNWVAILAQDKNTGSQATTTTTAGIFEIPVAGLKQVRARISGYSAGAVTIKGTALPQSLASLFSATINATVDGVKVKDSTGTNTLAIDADGNAPVKLSGSKMELYGASLGDRPDATTVPIGATFTIVDDKLDQNWISDGTNWEEV